MFETMKKIINNPVKILFGIQKMGLLDWISDKTYLKIIYKLIFKRILNLNRPESYTEKIAWYKLHWRNHLAKDCADKLKVREYVTGKIGSEYLIDYYGCWDSFDEIDFNKLPNRFVLKPTNGSGDVVVCRDKSKLDLHKARKTLNQYSKRHFSSKTKEWAYYDLPYRIIAERYIESTDGTAIKDYKIFCFFGQPKFLFVGSDRDSNLKFNFYDLNWNLIPVKNGHDCKSFVRKPEHFDEMLRIAGKLSEDFPHVRVDLYEEEGRVYFGELTFYHFGGFTRFEPDEWDYEFGKYFDLQRIPKEQVI
ncbi:MAG: glycosyltransferase [Herbinix sp.]|jgi:hypothetical protein|nr:glycosyltransferase [Herbinix sp.]